MCPTAAVCCKSTVSKRVVRTRPGLIGIFGFAAVAAVVLNKAMSLIVVLTAIPARLFAVPLAELIPHWTIVVNLLAGSLVCLVGCLLGDPDALGNPCTGVLAVLLLLIAAALAVNHLGPTSAVDLDPAATAIVELVARAGIGVVAALMGVAGGELLIPTIVLLYGLDIKIAGSLSLAVSLPTMLVAFARYSRDSSFVVLRDHARFAVTMAYGSITGTVIGGVLLGVVPATCSSPPWWVSCCYRRSRCGDTRGRYPALTVRYCGPHLRGVRAGSCQQPVTAWPVPDPAS